MFKKADGELAEAVQFTGENHDEVLELYKGRYVRGGVKGRDHDEPGSPAQIVLEDREGNSIVIAESQTAVLDLQTLAIAVHSAESPELAQLVAIEPVDLATPEEIAVESIPDPDSLPPESSTEFFGPDVIEVEEAPPVEVAAAEPVAIPPQAGDPNDPGLRTDV